MKTERYLLLKKHRYINFCMGPTHSSVTDIKGSKDSGYYAEANGQEIRLHQHCRQSASQPLACTTSAPVFPWGSIAILK